MRIIKIVFLKIVLIISVHQNGAYAQGSDIESIFNKIIMKQTVRTQRSHDFGGLRFTLVPESMNCTPHSDLKLECTIFNPQAREIGKLLFTKIVSKTEISLPLLQRAREQQWKKNLGVAQVSRELITLAKDQVTCQMVKYFRFLNRQLPVLIRAFDVVIDKRIVISVSTTCDEIDWPVVKKITDKFEASVVRTAQ